MPSPLKPTIRPPQTQANLQPMPQPPHEMPHFLRYPIYEPSPRPTRHDPARYTLSHHLMAPTRAPFQQLPTTKLVP